MILNDIAKKLFWAIFSLLILFTIILGIGTGIKIIPKFLIKGLRGITVIYS